ncbi:MAG: nuclear transport factor 2 family protein [Gammaproteobacteria bacterium]|nr:nuclear transport factor 2 family protein [Gammaproteobacteria bacterium]
MTDAALRRLLDERAINAVLIDYCRLLDVMDLDSLSSLFTADCFVDYGPDPQLQSSGAAALAESLQRMWRWTKTSHHLSNVSITFDGDDCADVQSYVYAWHKRADGTVATILGQYIDRFLRCDDRWLIARRRMLMNGCNENFTVDINRLERNKAPDDWVAPDIDRSRRAHD